MVVAMYYHVFPPQGERGNPPAPASGAAMIRQKLPEKKVFGGFLKQKPARRLVSFVCAATAFTVGCSKAVEPPPFVAIEHGISPQPARIGPVTVTLKLTDATGKLLTGAHIAIEADMSHAA